MAQLNRLIAFSVLMGIVGTSTFAAYIPTAILSGIVSDLREETIPRSSESLLGEFSRVSQSLTPDDYVLLVSESQRQEIEINVVRIGEFKRDASDFISVDVLADKPGLAMLVADELSELGVALKPGKVMGISLAFGGRHAARLVSIHRLKSELIPPSIAEDYEHASTLSSVQEVYQHPSGRFLFRINGLENGYFWGDVSAIYQQVTRWQFGGSDGHGACFKDYRAEENPAETHPPKHYGRFVIANGKLRISYQGREEFLTKLDEDDQKSLIRRLGKNRTKVIFVADERTVWDLFFDPEVRDFIVVDLSKTDGAFSPWRVFRGVPGNMNILPIPPDGIRRRNSNWDSLTYAIQLADGSVLLSPHPSAGMSPVFSATDGRKSRLERLDVWEDVIRGNVPQFKMIPRIRGPATGAVAGAVLEEYRNLQSWGIPGLDGARSFASTPLDLFFPETCQQRLLAKDLRDPDEE